MYVEKLEQLSKLKEKEKILSQDKLKNGKTRRRNDLIAVGVFIFLLLLFYNVPRVAWLLSTITTIVLAILSYKYEMSKYDKWYCAGPFGVIICCFFIGFITIPLFIYGLLQIKDNNIPLKTEKK